MACIFGAPARRRERLATNGGWRGTDCVRVRSKPGPAPSFRGRLRGMQAFDAPKPAGRRRLIGYAWLCAAWLAGAAPALAQTVQHGPFEIVAQGRRISSGTFPNIGGNPFATIEVTGFSLRWRGRPVEVPGRGTSFWGALRLPDAPHHALLLVARDFTLVSEQDGALRVQPLRSDSNTLAEAQWLDSDAGQPGPSLTWGIQKVDPATATLLRGGRWLRLGSRLVLDVQTLAVHAVEPWVPMRPGEAVTSLMRNGDHARMFSPGRSAYVLAGSQYDYARGRGQVHGLLVVDITRGHATELRVQRRSMPFASLDDMDHDWIAHYFQWQRDADGRERLRPRPGVRPRPWRGRLVQPSPSRLEYHVERMRPAFADELRRIVLALPGAALAPDWVDPKRAIDGRTLRVGSCLLGLQVLDPGLPEEDFDGSVVIYAPGDDAATRGTCNDTIRRIAAAADAELASGRHDKLLVLD